VILRRKKAFSYSPSKEEETSSHLSVPPDYPLDKNAEIGYYIFI